MLPELTKLKITAVHCEHLSTHLVTGQGRQDALVRPGSEQSVKVKFNHTRYRTLGPELITVYRQSARR